MNNIMKAPIVILFVGLVFLVLMYASYTSENTTLTGTSTNSVTTKFKVVTSVVPITNIVKNIGGDRIDTIGIIPEGSDSHTFEWLL
jgi:ABC-type Zn uptake system ZnuABC Zn-binding protein ZnuA